MYSALRIFPMLCPLSLVVGIALAGTSKEPGATDRAESVDFQRDIRPILSENCFQCHGPDENTREADLRLDLADAAQADLGDYAAIIPGDASESEAMKRVLSDDEYEQMPPADSGKELTEQEIELLRRWIESGAEYEEHWAFVSPQRPELPQVSRDNWPANPIDYFVLQRLDQANLTPTEPADRYQLVRRVYLDLIGLPPTVEEADAFVADTRPDAYE